MADYVPEEIILKILPRLPVEALLRCTSVCKSWYSLITSSQFIQSHLNFSVSTRNKNPLILLRRCIRNRERYDLHWDAESFSGHTTFEFPFRSVNSFFTIVGSCNGLLCLSDDRLYYMQTIILWNPCIRRSVNLPKPNLIYGSNGSFMQCLGFGFDPSRNDYKVVRITYVDCGRSHPQIELYKLSSGIWQDMSFLNFDYAIYNKSRQTYVNGATHWVASYDHMDYSYGLIVVFDMIHEVFREMMLPDNLDVNSITLSTDLVVFRDSLTLIVTKYSGFCVWVMKEYGVQDSWTKYMTFDYDSHDRIFVPRPLWVGKCGEVVVVGKEGHLISCNSDDGEIKDLGVHGSGSDIYSDYCPSIHADNFVKSLVLLKGQNCFPDEVTHEKLPILVTS